MDELHGTSNIEWRFKKEVNTVKSRAVDRSSIQFYTLGQSKTFWKIESVNKAFLFWYWQRLKKIFFRNKTFLFFKIESWNFQVQFEIKIRETSQNFNSFSLFRQLLFSWFFIGCLIKLKFCKVSRNSISKWTWKFQLSILKNKKVLFLKKKNSKPLSKSKQKSFVYRLNFLEGFDSAHYRRGHN